MKIFMHHTKPLLSVILIVFLFGILSCSKEKKGEHYTAIYGKILDYNTLEPITGVYIIMKDGFAGGAGFYGDPLATGLTATAYTDHNGQFFIELKDHSYNATLGVEKDGYLSYKYIIDDYHVPHSFPSGIYPDYVIRLKPVNDE